MSQEHHVSFEELNYFIDGQLSSNERMQVLDVLKKDDELSRILCELQRNDESILIAYSKIPEPTYNPFTTATRKKKYKYLALVASMLVIISSVFSWRLTVHTLNPAPPAIMELNQLGNVPPESNKVLIHISKMDDGSINIALDKAEALLQDKNNTSLQVEIIANASGLGVLRKQSPYAPRIASLVQKHHNISFKACGIAMQAAKLKEGKEVELLPEAEKVPAALDEILLRLKKHWTYFKV